MEIEKQLVKLAEFIVAERNCCEICRIYPDNSKCPFVYPGALECIMELVNFAKDEERK